MLAAHVTALSESELARSPIPRITSVRARRRASRRREDAVETMPSWGRLGAFLKPMDCFDMVLTGPSPRTSARGVASLWIKAGFAPRWTSNVVTRCGERDLSMSPLCKAPGCSKLLPRRRRDARRRECFESTITPSPRLNRPRRPNAIDATRSSRRRLCLNTSSGRGRFDGAGASRRGRRRRRLRAVRTPTTHVAASRLRDLPSARLPLRMQHRRRRSACVDGAPPAPRPGRHRHGALSVIFLYALLAAGGARGDELREITCYRQDREGSTLSGAR